MLRVFSVWLILLGPKSDSNLEVKISRNFVKIVAYIQQWILGSIQKQSTKNVLYVRLYGVFNLWCEFHQKIQITFVWRAILTRLKWNSPNPRASTQHSLGSESHFGDYDILGTLYCTMLEVLYTVHYLPFVYLLFNLFTRCLTCLPFVDLCLPFAFAVCLFLFNLFTLCLLFV